MHMVESSMKCAAVAAKQVAAKFDGSPSNGNQKENLMKPGLSMDGPQCCCCCCCQCLSSQWLHCTLPFDTS